MQIWTYFNKVITIFEPEKNEAEMGSATQLEKVEQKELPDPVEQLKYLAPAVMEVLEGVRSVAQLGGMVTEDIYQLLKSRSAAKARDRFSNDKKLPWPNIKVSRIHHEYTKSNLVRAVILLTTDKRTRAVAIRLEGRHRRWVATAITVL
jgi:hypothetical protein